MSDSVRPHRRQPTRLPRPWDSSGKNTGVGCHFLLQCVKVKSLSSVQLFVTPWTAAYQAPLSMGFSRQEYWSGVPLPSPVSPILQSFPFCCFPLFLCIDRWGRRSYLSLLYFGTLHSNVYLSFSPLLFTSLLFTAICKASSDSRFAFLHFFFLRMVLIPVSCTMSRTSVHSCLRKAMPKNAQTTAQLHSSHMLVK